MCGGVDTCEHLPGPPADSVSSHLFVSFFDNATQRIRLTMLVQRMLLDIWTARHEHEREAALAFVEEEAQLQAWKEAEEDDPWDPGGRQQEQPTEPPASNRLTIPTEISFSHHLWQPVCCYLAEVQWGPFHAGAGEVEHPWERQSTPAKMVMDFELATGVKIVPVAAATEADVT